jgi:SAM-dependent methyltransferase
MNNSHICPVCSNSTLHLGSQKGVMDKREFLIRRCNSCQFTYVENYRSDFQKIYNEEYYCGLGADPMVDYLYELQNPTKTIRNYEWKGILTIFNELCPSGKRWLDYGCGVGWGVKYALEAGFDATGFEEGWAADMCRLSGITILHPDELDNYAGSFDFISAIEVLEHIPRPVDVLLQMRKLLKPGGILFITTGNAQPWREKILDWGYLKCPEVHVSFFEPETLARCMKMAGFQPKAFRSLNGFIDIIKYKVLKTLRIKNQSKIIDALPWGLIGKFVDARYQVSKQPYGIAIEDY